MLVTDGRLQTRRWKGGWSYDKNGLIFVRPSLGEVWDKNVSYYLDKGHASPPVRRAAFIDMVRAMAGEITPEVVYSRMQRRLVAQHEGNSRWNEGEPGVLLPPAP